jgi:hypothetical protein
MFARGLLTSSAALLALSAAQFAAAATCGSTVFCRSDTVTNSGGTPTVALSGFPDNGPVGTTISYSLGNAFGPGQTVLGADFTTTQTGGQSVPGALLPDSGWNFYDDYRFSLDPPGSTSNTAVITLTNPQGPAVSNLEIRLFSTGGGANSAPVLGAPLGGTIVDAWSSVFPGGSFVYTLPHAFAGGSYDLQIRGMAASGSSYGGTVNFTPVPLPAALPLLLSGFGLVAGLRRRRTASACI